jgi:nitrous oxidase accessory protein
MCLRIFDNLIFSIGFLYLFLGLTTITILAKEIIVSKTGTITTIHKAIELADDFDVILIKPGHYAEGNIIINKMVKIIGEDYPVIDGEGAGEVFTVTVDSVTISGLTITNSGISYLEENAGIRLEKVRNCSITNNKLISNFFAIYLAQSADCNISDNFIKGEKKRETNSGNGIHLWYSKNITIENNTISDHRDGIYFEFVRNGIIKNNHSKNNLRYGLHFMFSDTCKYEDNTFESNGAGVAVMYTKYVLMRNNKFINNWGSASYGILLKEISDSIIESNEFIENSTALYMEGCSRIKVEHNNLINNGWAIKLMANSMDNYFYENNFIANSFDVSTNSLSNFNEFERNYWSEYKGYDLNKDGFGDIPFRPVTMFSMMVQDQPTSLILLHSLFINILNVAESIIPAITPEALTDAKPRMRKII